MTVSAPRAGVDPRRQNVRSAQHLFAHRPALLPFFVAVALVLGASFYIFDARTSVLGWIFTFIWSAPILSTIVGLHGIVVARHKMRTIQREALAVTPAVDDQLIVVVPTIGRHDTFPALKRSVISYCRFLPSHFHHLRIDVIAEEGCEAMQDIYALADQSPLVRIVVVPKHYRTRAGTRFKARANHYSHELRIVEREARPDIWVLHMDDDTGVGPDTAISIANFINTQRASREPKHIAQGVLTYPRENAVNKLTWLADAIRPSDDMARFAALTGSGTPLSGLHGELLLIRASVEAAIGWDFGPRAIVEDAQLALNFCRIFPGRSGWFEGRCYGASPATIRDFLKQRERWAWGLFGLSVNRTIPLRYRLFLGYCVTNWIIGPLQNVLVVLILAFSLRTFNLSPAARPVLLLWTINMAYATWMYWEGYKANIASSAIGKRQLRDLVILVLFLPFFSLLEGIGGIRGFWRFATRKENQFVVISKPV